MGYSSIALMNPETLNGEHVIDGMPHTAQVESSPETGYYIALNSIYENRLVSQILIWADLNPDGSVSISHNIKKCPLFTKARIKNFNVPQADLVHANGILGWCKRNIKFPYK